MVALFTFRRTRLSYFWLVWLAAPLAVVPRTAGAQDGTTAQPARHVEALAGDLVRERTGKERVDEKDLLNKIDLAKHVVYTTSESPVPEAEQFQFVNQSLRTPEKGDARLVLPVEMPEFYRLSVETSRKDVKTDPPIGIGAGMSGHPFFVEMRLSDYSIDRFYDQKIAGPLVLQAEVPGSPGFLGLAEILVGDCGMLLRHRKNCIEFLATGTSMSRDPAWEVPEQNKIFLVFPAGRFDVRSIKLQPLSRQQWVEQVTQLMPKGQIAAASALAMQPKVAADVEPLPEMAQLRHQILAQARQGDFDALERWADRFRKDEFEIDNNFASEDFYDWLVEVYVLPASGTRGLLEAAHQAQLAFVDGWLKQKPASVAARIVKGRSLIKFAWDARGSEFAPPMPEEAWQQFTERLEQAELVLGEAAALEPRDSCAFSSLLVIGMSLGRDRKQMNQTLERGLEVSTKNFTLIDSMTNYLLPRWGGKPGELGEYATRMAGRFGGDDGLDAYGRIAMLTQTAEVNLERVTKKKQAFAESGGGYTDPKVVLAEFSADKLRAAIPVLRGRYPKVPRAMNYACWAACVVDDRETARQLFAEILEQPNLAVWGSRDRFDHWRHWSDPTVAEPSQFLPVDGKELAHLQAYCDGTVELDFLLDNETLITGCTAPATAIKVWNLGQQKIDRRFDLPEGYGNLTQLRLLADGVLFTPLRSGKRSVSVEYLPPVYGKICACPADFHGAFFNLIADDNQSAGLMTDSEVSINNMSLRRRKGFSIPKLKTASLSPNGKYLAGTGDKIHIWDSMAGKELFTLDIEASFSVFTPDSSAVICATADKLVVWDIPGNQERFSLPLSPQHVVRTARCTADGRFLAAAERRGDVDGGNQRHIVALYDLKQPEPVHIFAGHQHAVVRLAVARDGSRLASSSLDGVVKVWDLAAATAAVSQ